MSKWRLFSDEKPETQKDILITLREKGTGFKQVQAGWIMNNGDLFTLGVMTADDEPIAWQYMPEPYGEDDHG